MIKPPLFIAAHTVRTGLEGAVRCIVSRMAIFTGSIQDREGFAVGWGRVPRHVHERDVFGARNLGSSGYRLDLFEIYYEKIIKERRRAIYSDFDRDIVLRDGL